MTLKEGQHELRGRTVELTNLDRVLFPGQGITKGDLVDYYERVAPAMAPYLLQRPVALKRFPEGIDGEGFFQKNASAHFPEWLGRVAIPRRDGGTTDNVVVSEPAALPYLADQGTIELHTWLARADAPERLDQVVFDLDPPGEDTGAARRATRRVGDLLDELGLATLLKTSGSAGYHVHVRVDRDTAVDVHRFAADAATLLTRRHPEELTDEHRKRARGGRVLVDHFRNRFGQTVVAPYSVRARPGAPVSAPIDWAELPRVDPQHHTMSTIFRRLGQREDPWAGAWEAADDLVEARAHLDRLLGQSS